MMLTCYAALQAISAAVVPHQLLQLLYVQVADSMQQQVQMGMADANPQMLLGSGALTDAVTAAMHAVPSGNVYWGDAAVRAGPGMSAQDMSAEADPLQHQDALQHQGALQPHLAGEALQIHCKLPFNWFCLILPTPVQNDQCWDAHCWSIRVCGKSTFCYSSVVVCTEACAWYFCTLFHGTRY